MRTPILFIFSLPLFALQDADFSGSNYLSFTGPSVSLTGDYRMEFRMRGFAAAGVQGVLGNNDFGGPNCILPAGTVTLRCRDNTGAGDQVDISLTGRPDVRVRFQRFGSTGVRLLEVWNADGSNYTSASITNAVGTISFGNTQYVGSYFGAGSICDCTLGFARWWSTTVAQGSSAPPDTVTTKADLIDLELEGSTADSSGRGISVTTTGGALSYATTTLYAPSAVISSTGAARAGSTFNLSASTSSNLTDDQPLSYFWQAPTWSTAAPTFSTRTASATTMTVPTAQTVTVRLRVTDSLGQIGTVDATVGSVATDSSSRVIQSDANLATVLGPQLRSGASTWPSFDANEIAVARALIATIPESPGDTPAAGTISVTNGSATVTGSGTNFISLFDCAGSDFILILYPLSGGGTGRRAYRVNSCASPTSITIEMGYEAPSSPISPSGVQYAKLSSDDWARWRGSSNNWNYYDAVVAFYRLYARTGNTTYRDFARDLADRWWRWPYDGGRAWTTGNGTWMLVPRVTAAMGLMLRAYDGKPEYWPGIVDQVTQQYGVWLNGYFPYQPASSIGEVREQGYVSIYTILLALLHPNSGTRATWLANANSTFNYWKNNQRAWGGWDWVLDPNQNYAGAGNFPWQGFAVLHFLRLHHLITNDVNSANALQSYVDYVIAEGVDSSNDGGFYEDGRFTFCPHYDNERTGTVTATNGSTAVTGSGTQFQSQYGCNGTDTIGIQDSGGTRRGYTVASCSSQTAMTLATAYAGATESGRRILRYAGAGVTPPSWCQISYGTTSDAKAAARTLLNAMHGPIGWVYEKFGTSSYLTTGDRLFAQNLGLGGPGNDGVVGHYADVVSGGTAPSFLALTYLSKEFAFGGGVGGAQSYLAHRLGTPPAPSTTSYSVNYSTTGFAGAAKARVTITQPSGAVSTATCTSSPCVVSGLDTRQGTAGLMQFAYLSASDAVLAAGDQQQITIQ